MTVNCWGSENPVEETKGGLGQSSYSSGDLLYSSTANTLSKLSIGSDGDQLVVASGIPSWVAPRASNFTLVGNETASNDASINFIDTISTGVSYMIVITDLDPVTNAVSLRMRTSTDNGSTWDSGASDYGWTAFTRSGSTSRTGDTSDNSIRIGDASTSNIYAPNFVIWLYNPSSTDKTYINYIGSTRDSGSNYEVMIGSGVRQSAADVTAIQFFYSSGNVSLGSIRIYEVST